MRKKSATLCNVVEGGRVASVKKNFLYSSAYQLLVAAAPLVTTPYLSRVIGSAGNGVFTYTQSITNYFVLVAVLGMSNYGVRTIAECADDRDQRSKTFWELWFQNVAVGVVVIAAYLVYAFGPGREYLQLWMLWGMWVLASVLDVTWLLWGMQEFRIPTIRNFCTRLASIALIFVLVRSANDVWGYVFAISGAYLANALLVWPVVGRYVDWVRPTWQGMRAHLVPNLTLFVPVIATSLYTIMDKVMLGSMAGMEQTGLYDYAEKVSKMPLSVITALGAVVLPKMTTVIAEGRLDEGKQLVRTTMWFMLACALALAFGIAAVAPEFCLVFLGPEFGACTPLLRLLCVIVPLICATNVMGVQYLLPTKRDRLFTASVACGAVVNIVTNVFAIPVVGALGASIATVAAEVAVLVFQAWVLRKELPLAQYALGMLPFLAIGTLMLVGVRAVSSLLGSAATTVAGLLVEVAAGGIVYLTLSYLWCRATKSDEFRRVLPRLARW